MVSNIFKCLSSSSTHCRFRDRNKKKRKLDNSHITLNLSCSLLSQSFDGQDVQYKWCVPSWWHTRLCQFRLHWKPSLLHRDSHCTSRIHEFAEKLWEKPYSKRLIWWKLTSNLFARGPGACFQVKALGLKLYCHIIKSPVFLFLKVFELNWIS